MYFAPPWMFGSTRVTSPTPSDFPVAGISCMTPIAPTALRASWFSRDSWNPCAASISGSKSYFAPYFSKSFVVASKRLHSAVPVLFAICLTRLWYFAISSQLGPDFTLS
jgi:hypothetical protein